MALQQLPNEPNTIVNSTHYIAIFSHHIDNDTEQNHIIACANGDNYNFKSQITLNQSRPSRYADI
jgi:hypothetical protein